MNGLLNDRRVDDELLERVTGGTETRISYGMENDPLYKKFSDFWNGRSENGVTGEGSRTEFVDTFKKWVKDGMPSDISNWYKGTKA